MGLDGVRAFAHAPREDRCLVDQVPGHPWRDASLAGEDEHGPKAGRGSAGQQIHVRPAVDECRQRRGGVLTIRPENDGPVRGVRRGRAEGVTDVDEAMRARIDVPPHGARGGTQTGLV